MKPFRRIRREGRPEDGIPKPTRREAWHAVAGALDGQCVEGARPVKDKAVFQHLAWTIVLDTYTVNTGQTSVTYTRIRAPFTGSDDFKLTVARRNWLSRFGIVLRARTIRVGSRAFDDKYVTRTNNEARARSLLNSSEVRALIMEQPSLRLEIRRPSWSRRRKLSEGARDVIARTTGVVTDAERLENYVLLVAHTLDQLLRIGSATKIPVKHS
ncbi:MAG: hypothetical protein BMS9Abin29_1920 [Gemmatimonadota bacterium]|nr:MAG: hypothetical protein BMS9Abin29_1920 [Gemmatimonadota bacterium]